MTSAAAVTWAAPSSSGGSAVTAYRVTVSPGSRVIDLPATARSASVPTLVNGRAYTISVAARNGSGLSTAVSGSVTPASSFGYQVALPATVGLLRRAPRDHRPGRPGARHGWRPGQGRLRS